MILRLVLLSAAIAACLAQTNTATIDGAVTDAQGAVVAESDVVATNLATGARSTVKTNSSGFTRFPFSPLEVTHSRYKKRDSAGSRIPRSR